ncbi:MAG: Glutamate-tRNA ligase [Parcubacteria group bacterium GW2011_GWA2_31_28]|nr:MAG: Glutamate-tRNA ligase [Parcubacteria group bacterium GW2011_GWA2_31_28]
MNTLKIRNMIKTRIAPAPTGKLHIGSARTALFNYLFAKKNSGSFVLRIEDTDKERSKQEFERDIIENLEWLGLKWDEFYKQSERIEIYKKYLKKIVNEGKAFWCDCFPEKEKPFFCQKHKKTKNNKEQVMNNGIIRFNMPKNKEITFKDIIRGKVKFNTNDIGDFSIAKNLDTPLYNFAVVIDDYEMLITHIIRGEDGISNTPKQVLLYDAFNFEIPEFAHIPLILDTDRSKLSKRKNAVAIGDYKKQGYLGNAMINFLALLGWHPKDEREIFNLKDLIKEFSLERVKKGGAVFDFQKLDDINGYYINQMPIKDLCGLLKSQITNQINNSFFKKIVEIEKGRMKKLNDFFELTDHYFKDKLEYNKELLFWKEMSKNDLKKSLENSHNVLNDISEKNWNLENIKNILMEESGKRNYRGEFLWPLRVALSGKKFSASPFEIAWALGKKTSLKRINEAQNKILV